jgi:hypothetical protein
VYRGTRWMIYLLSYPPPPAIVPSRSGDRPIPRAIRA